MDWQAEYRRKRVPAEQALASVQSGNRVVVGHAAGEPVPLVEELVRHKDRLRDVEIIHMIALGKCEYCRSGMERHFRHNSLFAGKGSHQALAEGRADYTPAFFSETPRLFRDRILPVDVALIQVSPMDRHGFMSYGVSVDYTRSAAESAGTVIAEVNAQMPRTFGSFIHVSRVHHLVETDRLLIEIPPPEITPVEERIGRNVAELVPDGANLQLGIGGIPDAVLKFMRGKRDLGIHTEMFSDGVVELYEQGVVTNRHNNLNPGRFTACFLLGTRRLYDFADDNPVVDMQPVDYTNNVMVAGRLNNLVAINSAIQVDLGGQVCADTIGPRQYSGVGGQVDFVRAASQSPGGRAIIALPATARGGAVSRIVARLDPGACVTTSRSDVHFVVTEHGIADLRGRTLRQRAQALLKIAHPDFQERIRREAAGGGLAR